MYRHGTARLYLITLLLISGVGCRDTRPAEAKIPAYHTAAKAYLKRIDSYSAALTPEALAEIDAHLKGIPAGKRETAQYWLTLAALWKKTKEFPETHREVSEAFTDFLKAAESGRVAPGMAEGGKELMAFHKEKVAPAGAQLLRKLRAQIDAMPTLGVDADCVRFGVRLADYVQEEERLMLARVAHSVTVEADVLGAVFEGSNPAKASRDSIDRQNQPLKEQSQAVAKTRNELKIHSTDMRIQLQERLKIELPMIKIE